MNTTSLHVVLGAGAAGTAVAAEPAGRGLCVRHVDRSEIAPTGDHFDVHPTPLRDALASTIEWYAAASAHAAT